MPLLSSDAAKPSKSFSEVPRNAGEDNIQWLGRNLTGGGDAVCVLVGGTDPLSFRLRAAQSYVRHDLMPSHWSHVMLLDKLSKNLGSTVVHEISLDPPRGFGFPPPTNAVQKGRLGAYGDAAEVPNVAVLNIPVPLKDVQENLQRFQMQRTVLDAVALTVNWLAYLWGAPNSPNPLQQRTGIPSAAMLEVVVGAAGYDITPGLESRSSCPEAIWQAAKWWHLYYAEQKRNELSGAYTLGHKLD